MTIPAVGLVGSCGCCGGQPHSVPGISPSRRTMLSAGIGGLAAATFGGAILAKPASAQTKLSPDAAMQDLLDGNRRFVEKKLVSFDEDLAILKQNTASHQEPFAAILSCADSRVPVELVFDQSIGHLFVTRVAGNIATSEIIASLEYGAAVLGTKAILVLGHSGCGAVKAAIAGNEVPGQISDLFAMIQPAIEQSGSDLTAAIKSNALFQAKLLSTASPVLAALIKAGDLKILAGYYALDSGEVTILS
ncbi:carbonic anhydrase [Acidisoma cellulosilytica]|uniref:carbonic anhydrase n=1 Tax=Acidisoma cellulosilyticum TaxID=2802395 RepID=A0A963Z0R0_9PROT|nr:carbonic anhydrase [Acidisoma cellulosilyticum]MCB8879710.1 carbonic anhydrase [Acidisoma cellulosilyticum]